MTFRENIFAKGRCDSVTSFNRAIRFLHAVPTAQKKHLSRSETTADGHCVRAPLSPVAVPTAKHDDEAHRQGMSPAAHRVTNALFARDARAPPPPGGRSLSAADVFNNDRWILLRCFDRAFPDAPSCRRRAQVKWFNTQKGFGFITPDDGSEEIFVHQTAIHSEGFRSLREVRRATRHPRVPSVFSRSRNFGLLRAFFFARARTGARARTRRSRAAPKRARPHDTGEHGRHETGDARGFERREITRAPASYARSRRFDGSPASPSAPRGGERETSAQCSSAFVSVFGFRFLFSPRHRERAFPLSESIRARPTRTCRVFSPPIATNGIVAAALRGRVARERLALNAAPLSTDALDASIILTRQNERNRRNSSSTTSNPVKTKRRKP